MKNRLKTLSFIPLMSFAVLTMSSCNLKEGNGIIDVANYVDISGKNDASDKIQELINNNPHRILYFRDGTYLLKHQILTPGDPTLSVDLKLSNYAVLKASEDYQIKRNTPVDPKETGKDEYLYMVSLGGLDRKNDPTTVGSNYGLTGGIIDGSGRAAGIEIAGGRETRVQNVSMKGVQVGLHIGWGVNSGSSDADIKDLDIICNDSDDSYGLKLEGHDNSATNIRIGHVTHGVYVTGGTNILRNIHPLHNGDCLARHYDNSIGFEVKSFCEMNNCYSDNFRIAFKLNKSPSFLNDCIAWWFNAGGTTHEQYAVYKTENEFNATLTNFVAGFRKKDDQPVITPYIMGSSSNSNIGDGILNNVCATYRNLTKDIEEINGLYQPKSNTPLSRYFKDTAKGIRNY